MHSRVPNYILSLPKKYDFCVYKQYISVIRVKIIIKYQLNNSLKKKQCFKID